MATEDRVLTSADIPDCDSKDAGGSLGEPVSVP